jgi:hypothetical protein
MVKRKASVLLIASSLLMLPIAATAQSDKAAGVTTTTASKGGAVTAGALVERYSALAGSPENAKSLVNGLRSKTEVVLKGAALTPPPCPPTKPNCNQNGGSETVKFTPATEPMGWGNVDVALALMEADLKKKNVTSVKPRHIKAALMGETVTNVKFDGILRLRAAGMGWGEIANHLGFQLK